jgi:long-chain-alcohol oxidase
MEYSLDPYDGLSLLRGIIGACEIHLVAGAKRIVTTQMGVEDYYPQPGHEGLMDSKWKEWIAKVEKAGVWPGLCGIGRYVVSCSSSLPYRA